MDERDFDVIVVGSGCAGAIAAFVTAKRGKSVLVVDRAAGLAGYEKRLQESFVMRDLKTFSAWPAFMERWGAMFNDYPDLAARVMEALFVVDGEPQEHLSRRLMPILKEYGLLKLVRELRGALKVL